VSLVFLSFLILLSPVSARTIVHTSSELQAVLAMDTELGDILLDGDCFQLNGATVNAGGRIKPYGNRKPVLTGFQQIVRKSKDTKVQDGYWNAHVEGYGYANYFFLDENFESIARSKLVDGKEYLHIKSSDLLRTDRNNRSIKIKVPPGYSSLLNRNEDFFKYAVLKVGYWFVQMNIYNLKSDKTYLYGQIDNEYNYDLLDIRPNDILTISFFNFPFSDGGIFLDGNDMLHVPAEYNTARMFCSGNILTLTGDRKLTIEGLSFVGSMKPIVIKGSNKDIIDCSFKNCGSAVYCDYGVTNKDGRCSVCDCRIENLYNNNAITFVGCDDIIISNNRIQNTGLINKAGCVIQVGGDNFRVENNIVKGYSYIGIYAGISREHAAAKMTGYIKDNLVDNFENWGQADKQLTDGGGIYVITHTDGVVIENNIVRNIGYEGGEMWGIYLDDGAYNCTVRRNLVYNLWQGQYAATSRYVDECDRSNMNNVFENNIFIGPCKIAGNRKGYGNKTIIRGNYIAGNLNTQGDEFVQLDGNRFVSTTVEKDGKIAFGKGDRIKIHGFTRKIKKLIKK